MLRRELLGVKNNMREELFISSNLSTILTGLSIIYKVEKNLSLQVESQTVQLQAPERIASSCFITLKCSHTDTAELAAFAPEAATAGTPVNTRHSKLPKYI